MIRWVAGLGNPGPSYERTRHNIGARFVARIAERFRIPLKEQTRFKARVGRGQIAGREVFLVLPTTYMNLSGEATGALFRFYKFAPEEFMVAYDEMAFEPGVVRFRTDGGDNGHNGIRSLVRGFGNQRGFHRLRIGVGHPGDKDRVTNYLTEQDTPAAEEALIESALDWPERWFELLLDGEHQQFMNCLHGSAAQ
jgi:PTH1 family peptidyl-tRNA hydrolase